MKRVMPVCTMLMVFISFGCAGSNTIRTVQGDNIFYSSNRPEIRIKINPDFKLHEETDQGDSGFSTGLGEKSANVQMNKFLFLDRISGKTRAVEIVLKELTSPKWFFKPDIFNSDNHFDSGSITLQGKNYQCCTFAVKGPKDYMLVRGIGRIVGAKKNAMIVILYFEQVRGDWSNPNLLTMEQKKQLNDFIEDSKINVQILDG